MNALQAAFALNQLKRAKKDRRNELQRARRASPEAKAKEARASRKSYVKKLLAKDNLSAPLAACSCSICVKARELGL